MNPSSRAAPGRIVQTDIAPDSLLASVQGGGAYLDCYRVEVAGEVALEDFIEAFYSSTLFKLERGLLALFLSLPSSDEEVRELARGQRDRFAAWQVASRNGSEILLAAGRTRSSLAVGHGPAFPGFTQLRFGSAVLPRAADGKLGPAFHALLGFHRLYARRLLSAAAARLAP